MDRYQWIFLFLILFAGCEKQADKVPEPVVELIVPVENQNYSTFDTVFIKARIDHVKPISSITLSITDLNLKPVVSGKRIEPASSSYIIDDYLVIDNKYISGSKNYLQIRIEAGQEIYRYWYNININELTRELEGVLVVTETLLSKNLYYVKESSSAEKLWSWNSEYLGGYGDSHNNMFYTGGSVMSGLTGYDLKMRSVAWSVPPAGSLPYFTAFTAVDGSIAVGITTAQVETYNNSGLKILSTPVYQGGKFTHLVHSADKVLAVFSPYASNQSTLMVFNNPAGNLYASINFTGQPVKLFTVKKSTIVLVISDGVVNKAYEYDMMTNALVFLHNITSQTINSITGTGADFFIATPNGVLWYKPLSGSVFPFLQVNGITSLAYDELSNKLFTSTETVLNAYQPPYSASLLNIVFNEPVRDILLIYNK